MQTVEAISKHLLPTGRAIHCSRRIGTAMSPRFAPSAAGLALEYFTVQRASRSFWRGFAGLFVHSSGTRPFPERALPVLGVALLGSGDDASPLSLGPRARHWLDINDLTAHGDVARRAELRVEAPEQSLDRRNALERRARQRLADRRGTVAPVGPRKPPEARSRSRPARGPPGSARGSVLAVSRSLTRYSVRSSDSEWLA
jgi:hypothetical protein